MKAGDLVKITRASLGVAYGRLGLIVKEYDPRAGARSLRSDQMRAQSADISRET